jgi:hypothetical protein
MAGSNLLVNRFDTVKPTDIAFSVKLNMLLARSCCYSFFFFSFLLGTISSAGERSEVGVTPSSLVAVAGSPESVA